ncbi:MAG: response regulator transcription factor [Phycisphaerae bacterium]
MTDSSRDHSSIGVVLIDEHELVRQGIAMQINAVPGMRVVASSADAVSVVREVAEAKPDVVLIDGDLEESCVFAAIRRLRAHWRGIPVILIVAKLRDCVIERAQSTGIDGIVTKRDSFRTVRASIEAAVAGRRLYSRQVMQRLAASQRCGSASARRSSGVGGLTPRELEVLHHLVAGRSVRHTAALLNLASPTVDNHKARLMKKLGVHTTVELTRYAIREGVVTP